MRRQQFRLRTRDFFRRVCGAHPHQRILRPQSLHELREQSRFRSDERCNFIRPADRSPVSTREKRKNGLRRHAYLRPMSPVSGGFAETGKSAANSRLEPKSGLCFVEVTSISNRSASRLEISGAFLCFVGVTWGVGRIDLRLEIGAGSRCSGAILGAVFIGLACGAFSFGGSRFLSGAWLPFSPAALGERRVQNRFGY